MIGVNKIGQVSSMMFFFLVGCSSVTRGDWQEGDLLVSVKGESLYRKDLAEAMPVGLHGEDSARFATEYIRNWLEDVVLFKQAEENIPKNVDVEKMVAAYRRSLIIHVYQEELLHQKLSENISEADVQAYYVQHKELFRSECPYVKGFFLKVPLNSPMLDKVRSWCKRASVDDLDKLEKYSVAHAVLFDYFNEKWTSARSLAAKIPHIPLSANDYLKLNKNIEVKDTAFCYFLHVDDFLAGGEVLPIDCAKDDIKEMLMNMKKAEFIRQMKLDLYEEALKNKEIIYNKK